MHRIGRKLIVVTLSAFAAVGCQSPKSTAARPPPKPQPPQVTTPPPAACAPSFPRRYALYGLPPTVAPDTRTSKGQPLQWAVSHPVGKALADLAVWRDLGGGWSSIGLRVTSANASGLSVHLSGVALHEAAEIWLCSADGLLRRGPLRAGPEGELSAPVVPGSEAWLEVLAPTWSVPRSSIMLAEVYGGFR